MGDDAYAMGRVPMKSQVATIDGRTPAGNLRAAFPAWEPGHREMRLERRTPTREEV